MSEAPAPLVSDAIAIAGAWRDRLDLAALTRAQLGDLGDLARGVDVVALGKAAPEMADAASSVLGAAVRRRFLATEEAVAPAPGDVVAVGEHPVPGAGSAAAGRLLIEFLDAAGDADLTLFLVSGGASSLCAAPAPPLTVGDLRVVWDRALAQGWDITRLNRARAALSAIGGGAVLRRVRTARSRALVMVDNVGGGAPWVASGLTYEFAPSALERRAILEDLGPLDAHRGDAFARALEWRARYVEGAPACPHENRVVAEPRDALGAVLGEARSRGFEVRSMELVGGDVAAVVAQWADALRAAPAGPLVVAGAGEVTVRVAGAGRGGRCQEFALRMADVLAGLGRPGAAVARASDGRDFLAGVGGAWSDEGTLERLARRGGVASDLVEAHDTHDALAGLGQLLAGGRTGWNLCDLYVVALGAVRPGA